MPEQGSAGLELDNFAFAAGPFPQITKLVSPGTSAAL